ncbi:MAG: ComEC/Rec2 family competence protein [Candidatus Shapirobacteria bacterium]
MREYFLEVVYRSLPPQEAGLMAGMVWGDRSGFSLELTNSLKDSGLWHLVVVSGANVMILARMLVELLAPLIGRKKAIGVMMVMTWGYAGIVGWEMPVVRAIILMSIYYWAQVLGRKFDVWRSLMLTAILVLVADPEAVGSLSWWLSVVAFIGVITGKNLNTFWQTIWVGVWVTPLLAVAIGKISWISPLANVAVLFMVEVITVIGLIGTLTGGWLLWAAMPLLRWLLVVAGAAGKAGVVNYQFNWLMVIGWYSLLFWYLWKNKIKS